MPGKPRRPLRGRFAPSPDAATVDRWVATARAAMPGLQITGVSLPYGDGEPVIVQGQWRAWLVRERTNAAYLDPVTSRLLGLRVAHRLSGAERWVHSADPLHFGTFAGLGGRLLWAAFGLALTLMVVTGAVVHAKRLAPDARGLIAPWWRSLGTALVPTLVLIVALPAWFYGHGWDAGLGHPRADAGDALLGGQVYRLSHRARGGVDQWCATPRGAAMPATLAFVVRGERVPTAFDAGQFCAALRPGQKPTLAP